MAGKLRRFRIRVVLGDKVRVEVSPYDLTKGRLFSDTSILGWKTVEEVNKFQNLGEDLSYARMPNGEFTWENGVAIKGAN